MPFFTQEVKEKYVLLENQRWPVRPGNIMWRRINEATAFIKLFKTDKNLELRNQSGISRKINRMLKIKRVKYN